MRRLLPALVAVVALALALPALAGGRTVSFTTADGVKLAASTQGRATAGVVLVHDLDGDHTAWADVADTLEQRGLAVVAVSLRGHGASGGDKAPAAASKDIAAAAAYLARLGVKQVGVMGLGFGGAAALHLATEDPSIRSVVYLSPTFSAPGHELKDDLAAWTGTPLLLIAGGEDAAASRAAGAIATKAGDAAEALTVDGTAGGLALVTRSADVQGRIVGWLLAERATSPAASDPQGLDADGLQDVETKGTRFGEGG